MPQPVDPCRPHCAMPLAPDLERRVIASKRTLFAGGTLPSEPGVDLLDAGTLAKILGRPARTRPDTLAAPKANLATVTGSRQVLVILVDFSDAAATAGPAHFEELLFSTGSHPTGSMRDFYREASYGNLDVDGTVSGSGGPTAGWYRAPRPKSYYTDGNYGFNDHPKNAQGLVEDALELAAPHVDFSAYARGGGVEALVLVCAGVGAEESGSTSDIWSHKWEIAPQTRNGVTISRYFMAPENGRCGVMAHELGHLLCGYPDLYDTDYSSAGTGSWDLMAGGSWNAGGDRPAHPTAWCKLQSGWLTPTTVFGGRQSVTLAPYAANAHVVKLPVGDAASREYFLLSNRARSGFDDNLPGAGLVIEHCDDNRANNTDEAHYLVDIEQCDGRRDLNLNANRGDATDVFPCGSDAAFTAETTPNSNAYDGSDSQVAVTGIGLSGQDITAEVSNRAGAAAGPEWVYHRRVNATFSDTASQWAWAEVDGHGWRRVKEGSPDGVSNIFGMCCTAVADSRLMHLYVDGQFIYTAYLV